MSKLQIGRASSRVLHFKDLSLILKAFPRIHILQKCFLLDFAFNSYILTLTEAK